MAIVLGYGLSRYLLPLVWTRRAFHSATARLKANKGSRVLFPSRPSHLNQLWAQYLSDREGTTVAVDGEQISTVDPEDTFTEHTVLRGYNRNMALAFAGVFTGLGILGTFLGLVEGLATIRGTGQDQVMTSILGLLGGMSTAFYTSIIGITLSLFWLFSDRAIYHQIQPEVVSFLGAVRIAYPVESADRLLHRLLTVEQEESAAIHETNNILNHQGQTLTGSKRLLEEQKGILQTLGTDLAVAFQDALRQSVCGRGMGFGRPTKHPHRSSRSPRAGDSSRNGAGGSRLFPLFRFYVRDLSGREVGRARRLRWKGTLPALRRRIRSQVSVRTDGWYKK